MRRRNPPAPFRGRGPLLTGALVFTVICLSLGTLLGHPLVSDLPTVLFLALVAFTRAPDLWPVALLLALLYVGTQFLPGFVWAVPTLSFLLPVAVAYLLSLPFAEARAQWGWLRKGRPGLALWLVTLVTSFVSAGALLLWAFWTDNLGSGADLLRSFSSVPRWVLFGIWLPAFALVNAAVEEAIYRGVLLEALRRRLPNRPAAALLLQASAFAAVHYFSGFPNGAVGYLMTFVYALVLGYLRLASAGLLLPLVAHVIADFVIGTALLLLVH